jgi:hypothetical protein
LLGDRVTRTARGLDGRRRLGRGHGATQFCILLAEAFEVITILEATRVRGRRTVLTGTVVRPTVIVRTLTHTVLRPSIII